MKKEEEKKEEKKKINVGKIIACIIMTITISISIFLIVKSFSNDTSKYQKELDEVNNEINTLKVEENEIFMTQGFTKEYYDIQTKISSLNQKKLDLQRKTRGDSKLSSIMIALFIPFFGGVFSVIIYNILNHENITQKQFEQMEKLSKSLKVSNEESSKTRYVPLKCPQCGANLKGEEIEKCPYCKTVLEKVNK